MAPSFFPFFTISFVSSGRTGIDLLLPCRGCKHPFHCRDAFLFDLISFGTTALMEANCLAFVARWVAGIAAAFLAITAWPWRQIGLRFAPCQDALYGCPD